LAISRWRRFHQHFRSYQRAGAGDQVIVQGDLTVNNSAVFIDVAGAALVPERIRCSSTPASWPGRSIRS